MFWEMICLKILKKAKFRIAFHRNYKEEFHLSIRINAKRISYRAGRYCQLVLYNQAIDDDDISFDDACDFTAVNQGASTSGSGC